MSRAVIQEANDRVNLAGKNVVVVGGTQGIGAATALRFASLGASVLISGRNEARGSSMVQSLRTTYSNASKILRREGRLKGNEKEDEVAASSSSPIGSDIPEFTFVKADIGTVEGCLSLVKEVKDWDRLKDEGIYALIMTAGSLNFGPRRENKEGIESTFATNFLSKFTILNSLLSQLQSSAHSRVVTVLHGACGVTVDPSDLQVTKGFNFIKAANNSAGLLDIMTDQFARRHTTTPRSPRFIHVFPGVVNTDSTTTAGFPWFIRYPAKLVLPFIATDPRVVADEIVYMCTDDGWVMTNAATSVSKETGKQVSRGVFVHPGLSVKQPPAQLEDEAVCEKILEETVGILKKAGWEGNGDAV